MPYTVKDVDGYKKGLSDSEKEQWVAVANSVLAKCMEDGGKEEACAAKAIQQASGVLKKRQEAEPVPDETNEPDEAEELGEVGKRLSAAQVNKLREAQAVISEILKWASYDDGEPEPEDEEDMEAAETELAESASGFAIGLAETQLPLDGGNRAPVEIDLKIIAPGAGNKHDNHWYPADMLRRDANVFEGVDVFVTDHRENERSERTKVGKIKSIVGFTEDGGPIGRTVLYDPELAEKTRNRASAGELGTLHCSILARGDARDGKVDGRKYKIVEAITRADAVDLVSRAGAGGRALSLAESESGGESMDEERNDAIEEQEAGPTEEPLEEVTLQEQQEPEEETPAPAMLEPEKVQELVEATNLPDAAKAKLSEAEYADEEAVKAAVAVEVAYIKEVTGSGKPFAQGAGSAPEKRPRTAEEADADFDRILTEVGMPHLGGH